MRDDSCLRGSLERRDSAVGGDTRVARYLVGRVCRGGIRESFRDPRIPWSDRRPTWDARVVLQDSSVKERRSPVDRVRLHPARRREVTGGVARLNPGILRSVAHVGQAHAPIPRARRADPHETLKRRENRSSGDMTRSPPSGAAGSDFSAASARKEWASSTSRSRSRSGVPSPTR